MKAPYVVFGNESENYAGNVGIFGSNSLLERYMRIRIQQTTNEKLRHLHELRHQKIF